MSLHAFYYNGSSASGSDTYLKCEKCDRQITMPEPYSLQESDKEGCLQATELLKLTQTTIDHDLDPR